MRRIGVLMVIAENDPEAQPRIAAFLAGLQAFGWKDGRNVRIDYRWAADDTGRAFPYYLIQGLAQKGDETWPDLQRPIWSTWRG